MKLLKESLNLKDFKDDSSLHINKTLVIYTDPYFTPAFNSHHPKILKYFEEQLNIEGIDTKLILGHSSKYAISGKLFRNFFLFADLILQIVQLSLFAVKSRKAYNRILVLNPNCDPIWLFLVVFLRFLLGLHIDLRIRFIGTIDRFFFSTSDLKKLYFAFIRKIVEPQDRFSSESLSYTRLLSHLLKKDVEYIEYPPVDYFGKTTNRRSHRVPVFLFVGYPRVDKGYLELLSIIPVLRELHLCTFRVQAYNGKDDNLTEVSKELSKLDYVEMLPPELSDIQVADELANCDLLLMPYKLENFRFRNSAVLFSSLYYGKFSASFNGTALHESAGLFNLAVDLDLLLSGIATLDKVKRNSSKLSTDQVQAKWKDFLL